MFLDARSLTPGTRLDADVCIVGAGAAGISLALALEGSPYRVLLLESGGFRRDEHTQELYAGDSIGVTYCPLDESRSRFFGGSTNCWGGWCKTFDPIDFEPRPWVAATGWPFGADELEPYHPRTASLLELGPLDFDPEQWEGRIANPRAQLLPLEGSSLENRIAQFSPPARFGRLYRRPIGDSANVTAVLHANLLEIQTDAWASVATGLRLATLGGHEVTATARIYVLAMGGIENARLLLLSNGSSPHGLGNARDLVGRCFMDHPRVISGVFTPSASTPRLDFYDAAYNVRSSAMVADGVSAAAFMSVRPEVQRREELLNNRIFFQSFFAGEDAAGTLALRRLLAALAERRRPRAALRDLRRVLRDADEVVLAAASHLFHPTRLLRARRLVTIVESEPNRESRVTLGADRDALGLPRATVDWRLGEATERTIRKVQHLVRDELARLGLGTLVLTENDPDELVLGVWHHMGTTRMSDDPAHGVVDRDCRVHGVGNLYVAGSSVFPVVSNDMPTFTIVALALRLADHLRRELERPRVDLGNRVDGQADAAVDPAAPVAGYRSRSTG
jgi:choline dehydrogenase-like flavoprotein